jgi:hypothetical protein
MADSNNHLLGNLPAAPSPFLQKLQPLIGEWRVASGYITGTTTFEWLDGGYFLVQHISLRHEGQPIKGVEYIGYDQDTQTLRSHYMDNRGGNFTYTWDVEDTSIRIWFGDKDSHNFFEGTFADGYASYSGRWQWPGGGYEVSVVRIA